MKTIQRLTTIVIALVAIGTVGTIRSARCEAGFGLHGHLAHGSCKCPQCAHVCKLTSEKVDEDKPCFNVESKVICIPRVVFPWQKDCCNPCANNGARLRTVCVMTEDKYTCSKCEYSWKAEKKTSGCSDLGGGDYELPEPELASPPVTGEVYSEPFVESLTYGVVDPERVTPLSLDFRRWARRDR